MKQLEIFFRTFWLVLFLLLPAGVLQAYSETVNDMDSVEISLVTCTPHEEIYSLYGHTALLYRDLRTSENIVFNYGVFNFQAPHFVARFVLGKTDYELGIAPLEPFCEYYRKWGCMVIEQVLNLTAEEKARILMALKVNYLPQNRVYRYNFFYDNCSTRPRDIIENNISGRIIYEPRPDYAPTFREMIHELTYDHHRWAAVGNDLLLGLKADFKATQREQEFLPLNLMYDFDHAQIYENGQYRRLVRESKTLVASDVQVMEGGFPLSPTLCAVILLFISLAVFMVERAKHRCYVWYDAFLMATTGLAGCLLFIMFFSEHPTTSTNLQILVFNPAWLFFIPAVIRRKPTRYWLVLLICLCLFLIGATLQDYAEGMEFLALCLLTRYLSHYRNDK